MILREHISIINECPDFNLVSVELQEVDRARWIDWSTDCIDGTRCMIEFEFVVIAHMSQLI